jgi:NADPH:quinone reductase-like Zn-dependent oxidoreductase
MKAIVFKQYGQTDVLHMEEIPKPKPKKNELLIKVIATTVTTADVRIRGLDVPFGFRLITKLIFGFFKPSKNILGVEFSGIVEEIGESVKEFAISDEVFGSKDSFGCYAEYIVVPETSLVTKRTSNVSLEDMAGTTFGGLTSLIYLRNLGKIKTGQKVLINGASGCLGVYGVQLAKYFGAEVTGVCSTNNVELVKSLGADHVIDYTKINITELAEEFDIIYDTVGKILFKDGKKMLKENGRFLLAVADIKDYMIVLWSFLFQKKKAVASVALAKKDDILLLQELINSGKIKPVTDRYYNMSQISEAHEYVETARKKGSVVIRVNE